MATVSRKEYMREWQLRNKERRKEYFAKYQKENKEKIAIKDFRNKINKDPDYEYRNLQNYFNKRDPYETIL